MVSAKSVEQQLKKLKFSMHSWGRSEVRELPNILLPKEQIYECVNGIYEGGFALLVATDIRVLLIDKKPLNYLTVEDLRFDMINELDYSHRLVGATISISAGSKNLKFKSYNQPRLRKLLSHVQHCMAESKQQQSEGQADQKQHLEQINQQLQTYLLAQHQQQQDLRKQLEQVQNLRTSDNAPAISLPDQPKPSPELSDFLFAQSLLKQYRELEAASGGRSTVPDVSQIVTQADSDFDSPAMQTTTETEVAPAPKLAELYADGVQEVFGKQAAALARHGYNTLTSVNPLEINPLKIAYSKLPLALRSRKFGGRPHFNTRLNLTSHLTPKTPEAVAPNTVVAASAPAQ